MNVSNNNENNTGEFITDEMLAEKRVVQLGYDAVAVAQLLIETSVNQGQFTREAMDNVEFSAITSSNGIVKVTLVGRKSFSDLVVVAFGDASLLGELEEAAE